ncbi:hypothetical protein D1007_32729 [Hordeum vulgare]|nr:hypothetical protein D1007_32729 [Hordeum vulgare]
METDDSSSSSAHNGTTSPLSPLVIAPDHTLPVASAPLAPAPAAITVLPLAPPFPTTAPSPPADVPSIHNLTNISTLIPFKLDVQTGSYSKWRELWRCVLSMYSVASHVAHYSDPALQTPAWRHADLTLLLLIYATITDALYEVIRGDDNTAYRAWAKLDEFFLAHQPAQAVHFTAAFRALTQGDLRIAEYCERLKALADNMADVNEPVTDRTLTLQLLHGLSRKYEVIATVLPMQTSFPTFTQARSRLLPEELNLDARDRADGSSALALGLGGGGLPGNDRGGRSPGNDTSGDRGKAPMDRGGNSSSGGDA